MSEYRDTWRPNGCTAGLAAEVGRRVRLILRKSDDSRADTGIEFPSPFKGKLLGRRGWPEVIFLPLARRQAYEARRSKSDCNRASRQATERNSCARSFCIWSRKSCASQTMLRTVALFADPIERSIAISFCSRILNSILALFFPFEEPSLPRIWPEECDSHHSLAHPRHPEASPDATVQSRTGAPGVRCNERRRRIRHNFSNGCYFCFVAV